MQNGSVQEVMANNLSGKSLGISRNLQDNAINFYIYPNPTAGKFTYKFEISEKRPVEVKLLTIDGRELWSRDWGELDAGVYYESLDFGQMDVANGTYPFQIKSKDDVEQIKIIFSDFLLIFYQVG